MITQALVVLAAVLSSVLWWSNSPKAREVVIYTFFVVAHSLTGATFVVHHEYEVSKDWSLLPSCKVHRQPRIEDQMTPVVRVHQPEDPLWIAACHIFRSIVKKSGIRDIFLRGW